MSVHLYFHERFVGPECSPQPLLRREVESLRPPLPGEYLLSGSDYGRDSRFRAQTMLGSHGVLVSRQERFAMQIRGGLLESRLGLTMGDFSNVFSLLCEGCEGLWYFP